MHIKRKIHPQCQKWFEGVFVVGSHKQFFLNMTKTSQRDIIILEIVPYTYTSNYRKSVKLEILGHIYKYFNLGGFDIVTF